MRRVIIPWLLFLTTFSAAPGESARWPTEDWPRASPAKQGLAPEPIDTLVATLRENREIRNIHSLLIVHNGWLVVEEYFGEHDASDPRPMLPCTLRCCSPTTPFSA